MSDEFSQTQDDETVDNSDMPVIENLQEFLQPTFQFDTIEDEFM